MTASLPAPLDGPEYARVCEVVEIAARIDGPVSGRIALRLVATVEATRRLVDELRETSGLDDLIRTDWST